jgi:hypothetical protein
MVDFNDKDWHMTDPTSRQRGRPKKTKQVKCPRFGLDTKTYWLTDRQSQCDFDFEYLNKRRWLPYMIKFWQIFTLQQTRSIIGCNTQACYQCVENYTFLSSHHQNCRDTSFTDSIWEMNQLLETVCQQSHNYRSCNHELVNGFVHHIFQESIMGMIL